MKFVQARQLVGGQSDDSVFYGAGPDQAGESRRVAEQVELPPGLGFRYPAPGQLFQVRRRQIAPVPIVHRVPAGSRVSVELERPPTAGPVSHADQPASAMTQLQSGQTDLVGDGRLQAALWVRLGHGDDPGACQRLPLEEHLDLQHAPAPQQLHRIALRDDLQSLAQLRITQRVLHRRIADDEHRLGEGPGVGIAVDDHLHASLAGLEPRRWQTALRAGQVGPAAAPEPLEQTVGTIGLLRSGEGLAAEQAHRNRVTGTGTRRPGLDPQVRGGGGHEAGGDEHRGNQE